MLFRNFPSVCLITRVLASWLDGRKLLGFSYFFVSRSPSGVFASVFRGAHICHWCCLLSPPRQLQSIFSPSFHFAVCMGPSDLEPSLSLFAPRRPTPGGTGSVWWCGFVNRVWDVRVVAQAHVGLPALFILLCPILDFHCLISVHKKSLVAVVWCKRPAQLQCVSQRRLFFWLLNSDRSITISEVFISE